MMLQKCQIRRPPCGLDQSPCNFHTGSVACMEYPAVRMPAFLAQEEMLPIAVKGNLITYQILDRSMPFSHYRAHGTLPAQPCPRIQSIRHVASLGIPQVPQPLRQHGGNPPLRPGRVGFVSLTFGQNDHRSMPRRPQRKRQSGNPGTNH